MRFMKLKTKEIDILLSLEAKPLFLNAPINDEEGRDLTDQVKSEGDFYDGADKKAADLHELLSQFMDWTTGYQ